MTISEVVRNWLLEPVLDKLRAMEVKMANDKAALDAILTAYGTAFADDEASLSQLLAKVTSLITLVQNGATPQDFTNEVTALQSLVSSVQADKANMDAAVASATKAGA